jgi:MPBQ/MSBQ methyltransferase
MDSTYVRFVLCHYRLSSDNSARVSMKVVKLISLLAAAKLSHSLRSFGAPCVKRGVKTSETALKAFNPASAMSTTIVAAAQLFPVSVSALTGTQLKGVSVLVALLGVVTYWINKVLWTPSRTYDKDKNTVGTEYDAWTREGILEYYWGEHIHLGYYDEIERKAGYKKKNFIQAKYDFIDEMAAFGEINFDVTSPIKVLDVGCGIGGTSRYLAKKYGDKATVTGITLSPNQVERATSLAKERGLSNANFQVMDALNMTFPDNSFDVVWACESGEHMPDKKKYVEEMTRVLKPGGRIVIATW